jgi:hypothetical protein
MQRLASYFMLVLTALCCLTIGAADSARAQMVSVVNSTADDENSYPWDDPDTEDVDESVDGICRDAAGRCTLRAALDEAAAIGTSANVTFSAQAWGVITLRSGLDGFGAPKGSTIKGHNGLPYIQGTGSFSFLMGVDSNTTIQGLTFANATEAIVVGGSGSLIGGSSPDERNIFFGMTQAAINLIGDSNVVKGNYIGITSGGTPNANQFGVFVSNSSRNVIGGASPGEANIISGNNIGIALVGDSTETGLTVGKNEIIGNRIGTDTSGTSSVPNQYGILTLFQHALTIGSLVHPGKRNIISGNSVAGISLGANADSNFIFGNYIGSDITGVFGVGNQTGIQLGPGSSRCLVVDNLISSNTVEGITISGYEGTPDLPSRQHVISGNTIVLNELRGITIDYLATDNIIGSSLTQGFAQNNIQYNGTLGAPSPSAGITVKGFAGLGIPRRNTIRKNDFLSNTHRGILFDLGASVQNGIQPPSIIDYTNLGGGAAGVTVRHHRPGSTIDIYTAQINQSSQYEGRQWLGSGVVVDSLIPFGFTINACACTHIVATATDQAGNTSEFSIGFAITTDVPVTHDVLPTSFALESAYPNPFNPSTTIRYALPHAEHVTLKVFDVLGREVASLVDEEQAAGFKSVSWEPSTYASGVYFYQLTAGSFSAVKKFVFAR